MESNGIFSDFLKILYNDYRKETLKVYEIFKDFFGEEYVDYQSISENEFRSYALLLPEEGDDTTIASYHKKLMDDYNNGIVSGAIYDLFHTIDEHDITMIYVHFPEVTVTNEHDKSIDIYDLFVRVQLTYKGRIHNCFQMIRSTFTSTQFKCCYVHSHMPYLYKEAVDRWSTPCLGTGPIRNTISTLLCDNSEHIWNLFCFELSKYVTVESLSGIPYIQLESVHDNTPILPIDTLTTIPKSSIGSFLHEFIKYIISNELLKFSYAKDTFVIAESHVDYMIHISNLFIKWFNEQPISFRNCNYYEASVKIMVKAIKDGKKFYTLSETRDDYSNLIGKPILKFKGKTIKLNIIDTNTTKAENAIMIMHPEYAYYIKYLLLSALNIQALKLKYYTDELTTNEIYI